jgi:AcrR family transcriptional regulator
MQMKRGRRKTENPETARRILATAERIFALQGLAGARTDEIAAAAHVNKAMLYYYFSSKRRLHRSVLENLFRQLRDSVYPPRTIEQSARKRLLNYVNSYFDFLVSHPNFPRLVQRAAMEAGRNFAWIAQEYLIGFHKHVSRVIEDGIASGEFRKVDPHQAVLSINGLTVSYFAAAPIFSKVLGHNLLAPQALAKRRKALLDFLDHGLFRQEAKAE